MKHTTDIVIAILKLKLKMKETPYCQSEIVFYVSLGVIICRYVLLLFLLLLLLLLSLLPCWFQLSLLHVRKLVTYCDDTSGLVT